MVRNYGRVDELDYVRHRKSRTESSGTCLVRLGSFNAAGSDQRAHLGGQRSSLITSSISSKHSEGLLLPVIEQTFLHNASNANNLDREKYDVDVCGGETEDDDTT